MDKNGNTSQIGGQLSFAHHLTLKSDNEQYLSFGLSYKFTQFKIDVSDFENPNDPGNDPAQCLVIEDSQYGVQGAVAAGMDVLAYTERADRQLLKRAGGMPFSDMRYILEFIS